MYLGFYPYIENEKMLYNGVYVDINHLQHTRYLKGKSYAHWTSIIANGSDIDLRNIFPKFESKLKNHILVIQVLAGVLHSNDIYTNITLSFLIQCVEGYMRIGHLNKKFSDSIKDQIIKGMISSLNEIDFSTLEKTEAISKEAIKSSINGLLGRINEPSLHECLIAAFDTNKFTKMILQHEIIHNTVDNFIRKSKGTRNQFSHISPQDKTFNEIFEIQMAKQKYAILLRLLFLSDLDIPIKETELKKYIDSIDNEFASYN